MEKNRKGTVERRYDPQTVFLDLSWSAGTPSLGLTQISVTALVNAQ